MQKLTSIFIGATVFVLLVTGAFLGYRYFTKNNPTDNNQVTKTDENTIVSTKPDIVETNPIEEPNINTNDNDEIDVPEVTPSESDPDTELPEFTPNISTDQLLQAGFLTPEITAKRFSGIIFNNIDVSEYTEKTHLEYIIYENKELAGTITEMDFTDDIASTTYSVVKDLILADKLFTINETNQYGDASFFANNSDDKNSVFLVVKYNNRLYTLHYPAKNHNKMKNLLNILTQ